MHCPQCGQQELGEEHFCRRCGCALDDVRGVLACRTHPDDTDLAPGWLDVRVGADRRSRRGLHQGIGLLALPLAVLLFIILQGGFGFTLVPFVFLMRAFLILMTLPILRFGYAVYEAKQADATNRREKLVTTTRNLSLPTEGETAIGPGNPNVATGQLATPASVTERTTRLLDEDR